MANALLTSGGLALFRSWLGGADPSPPFYIAVSSGVLPSPPSVGSFWWQLPAETFRTSIVSSDISGPSVIYHAYLGLTDNQAQSICYYGLFGGTASLSANTGTLVAVANESVPFGKLSTETRTIDFVLTISGTVG